MDRTSSWLQLHGRSRHQESKERIESKVGKRKTFPVALVILFPGFTGMSFWSTDLISDTYNNSENHRARKTNGLTRMGRQRERDLQSWSQWASEIYRKDRMGALWVSAEINGCDAQKLDCLWLCGGLTPDSGFLPPPPSHSPHPRFLYTTGSKRWAKIKSSTVFMIFTVQNIMRHTNRRTDGHDLLQRHVVASEK